MWRASAGVLDQPLVDLRFFVRVREGWAGGDSDFRVALVLRFSMVVA